VLPVDATLFSDLGSGQKQTKRVAAGTPLNPENVRFGSLADMFDGMKKRPLYR